MALGPDWLRERRFWRASVDRDVDDELAFHLAMRAELLQRHSGMDPQAARDAALQRFGDVGDVRARCIDISHERERRMKRLELWHAVGQHARHALRRLRAAPAFAVAVLVMLALGIGATTAVFGVVDGILLRPLPFERPDRLVSLRHTIQVSGISDVDQSDGTFMLYQRHATGAFESIGAYRTRDVNLGALGEARAAERVEAATVSVSLFPTLRVAPERGRAFVEEDGRPGGGPGVVMLSHALWANRFGGDPGIVGRRIVVDGGERTVVGVMPASFRYPAATTQLWYPLRLDPAHASPASFNYLAVGRLRAGVSAEAARAELNRFLPSLLDEFPAPEIPREMWAQARLAPVVKPLRDAVVGDVGHMLWILLGAVGLLLVIACANVASLFLVRAEGAQRDVAIRVALGAGRGVVIAQYLTEALLLAAGGGALGVLLALGAVRALRNSPSGVELPRIAEVGVDGRVLLFAVAVTALSAVAVSLLAVLRARRVAPGVVLKESSRSATTGRERQRARSALVVAQVALALVLVAGSALMARSFARLRDVRPGFDPRGVFVMRVALPWATYPDAAATHRFYERVLTEVQALPGVRGAAVMDWLPLGGDHNDSAMEIEDHPVAANAVPPDHVMSYVSASYFATMGVPLMAGRTFPREDVEHPVAEAIVSHAFAERYWKGQSPIGRRVRPFGGPWYTIVGVAGDVHMEALEKPAEELVYFPMVRTADGGGGGGSYVPHAVAIAVRTSSTEPLAVAPAVRGIVRRADPALPTYGERSMAAVLAGAAARTRFVLLMLGAASLVALAIGAVGLYGVLAYGVTLRRREIGVRMALGASVRDVTRMIARRGFVLAALGVAAGLLGALATTRFLHGLLYGVSPTDPVTLAAASIVLLAVAAVASWVPARRAAATDPMESLRRD